MQIGLVGKPSSGKSTFFKAATLVDVPISPVPFTTIHPNVGVGYVSFDCVCKEFGVRCNPRRGFCKNGKRFVPIKLIDVGGLIPGSHEGRGIGNKFMDSLRQADGLIQIADFSGLTDEEGKPTKGFEPEREIKFLEEEIDLWFKSVVRRNFEKIKRRLKRGENLVDLLLEQLSGLGITRSALEETLREIGIEDISKFSRALRKKTKPILIVANKIDLPPAQENYERLKKKYENIIPASAEAELALKKASEKGLIDYLPGDGFKIKGEVSEKQKKALEFIEREIIRKYGSTGVQKALNKMVFDILEYIPVYPVADSKKLTDKKGNVLPDVFLVKKGTTLKEFAYLIHSEIGEKFICGIDARSGKRLGADYVLKPLDVIQIMFKK